MSTLHFLEHCLPDLEAELPAHGGQHGVPDLPMPVADGAGELVCVGEALAAGQLPH